MVRRLLLCTLTAGMILHGTAWGKPVAYNLNERTPVNAAARSFVAPGWGQYFNEEPREANIVAGSFVVTALSSYLLYSRAENTYQDYEARGLKNDPLYSDYESQSNQAMIMSLLAFGVWAYGIVDAYLGAVPAASANAGSRSPGLKISARGDGFELVFSRKF